MTNFEQEKGGDVMIAFFSAVAKWLTAVGKVIVATGAFVSEAVKFYNFAAEAV